MAAEQTVNQQVTEAVLSAETNDRDAISAANEAAGAAFQAHYEEGFEAAHAAADDAFNQAMTSSRG